MLQLSLNENTAFKLIKMESENEAMMSDTDQHYSQNPARFNKLPQVLCREKLKDDNLSWAIEWSGTDIWIGVTYGSIMRKGDGPESQLGGSQSWALHCTQSNCEAMHNNKKTPVRIPPSAKIGVHLNKGGGMLSFYNISDAKTLLHTFTTSFSEPLYAAFRLGKNATFKILPWA
ncbi:TRI16 protein, partial [Amia calva]|nr:TRI16 protein [Amia calva]